MPTAPPDYISRRWQTLRARMQKARLDGLLITGPHDVGYLSDFNGEDAYLFVKDRTCHLLTDVRFTEEIAADCPWVEPALRPGPMPAFAAEFAAKSGCRRIGYDPLTTSAYQLRELQSAARGTEFVGAPQFVVAQRKIKDDHEVALLRRSARIALAAFRQAAADLQPGMTEAEFAAEIEYHMRAGGADRPAFPTLVAVGERASRPHARAGARIIREGEPVLIDWGACASQYNSDLTRILCLGNMPTRIRELRDVVAEAQRAAVAAIAPGRTGREIDAVARGIIGRAGYGDRFPHGLGHGLGRELHEWPLLSFHAEADRPLEPGHVVTVEPGIYLPGEAGVRIEDDVLVTAAGCEPLTELDR